MMLLFFAVIIIGKVVLQYYLTGNTGIRSGARLKSSKEKLISFSMFGVLGVQVFLTWLFASSYIEAYANIGGIGTVLGVTLCVVGIVFTSYAQHAMGKEWRIGVDPEEKTELVTTGIYGKIRNPIYTGCIIHGAGVMLLAPQILIFLVGVIGFFAIRAYVKEIEEPYLISLHGEDYRQYMSRTGSFFPKF